MKIAVAGGGIFGCTAAFLAARAGHEVSLYEPRRMLMMGASSHSYYRLHRGYHYPRSPETGIECRASEMLFREEYEDCIIPAEGGSQLYAIADDGSLTSRQEFERFMGSYGLVWVKWRHSPLIKKCRHQYSVAEPRIDEGRMSEMASARLWAAGVRQHTGCPLPQNARAHHDKIIVAAYANINGVLKGLGLEGEEYKFQVVEKPIVRMQPEFSGVSIVVLDGPFCCIDPHGQTEFHVLGHVKHTVHCSNVGLTPEIPAELMPYINAGVINTGYSGGAVQDSRAGEVISAIKEFVPAVGRAEYVGSMFTLRAHLPGMEDTDARPTIVRQLDDQVVSVFSGKIGTAVTAGLECLSILNKTDGQETQEAPPAG